MAEEIIGIGIAYDTSQLLTGSKQVQDALRQVEQAEKSAQGATKALEQSSGQAATAMTQESQAARQTSQAVQQSAQSTVQASQSSQQFATQQQALAQASQQAASALVHTKQATEAARTALYEAEKAAGSAGTSLASLAQQTLAFGAAQVGIASVAQAISMVQQTLSASVQTATRMEALGAAFKGITGSSQEAGRAVGFVREQAQRLGVEFEPLAAGYKTIAAAARGTTLEGEQTRQAFLAVAEAGRVFQLSSQDMQGALLALGQMISKGTVSAEELRGQLGERLPGAFQIAARAMGVSTAELGKMLEQGQLLTSDFLPKFAAQMRTELGGAVEQASQTAAAAFARFSNAIGEVKTAIGEGLLPSLASAAEWFAKVAKSSLMASDDVRKASSAVTQAQQAMAAGVAGAEAVLERIALRRKQIAAAEGYSDPALREQRIAELTKANEADLQLLERRQQLERDLATQETNAPGAVPGAQAREAVKKYLDEWNAGLEKINRQRALGMSQEDALQAKIKLGQGILEKARVELAAKPGTFEILRGEFGGTLGSRQAEVTGYENQLKALRSADADAKRAQREADREAREQEQQRKKDLDEVLAKGKSIYEQDDDVVQLRADLQRRTEALMYTEEERFRLRVQQLAEEHPALQQILEDELARYDAAQRTNDALKERNKLLQDQASASKAQLDDINRIMGQLGPSKRNLTTEERLKKSYADLQKVTSDEGTLARARAEMSTTLATEQWNTWRDVGMDALHDLTNEFAQMAFAGKLSFTDLATHAVQQMFRIASEATMQALFAKGGWLEKGLQVGMQLLGALGGTGSPSGTLPTTWPQYSAMSAAGALSGRQGGGPVEAGRPYWVGEAGPELMIPRQSGMIVPHGQAGGGPPAIIVNVHGVTDASSFIQSQGAVQRAIARTVATSARAL